MKLNKELKLMILGIKKMKLINKTVKRSILPIIDRKVKVKSISLSEVF